MRKTAAEKRLLDPFDPVEALPKSAAFHETRESANVTGLCAKVVRAVPPALSCPIRVSPDGPPHDDAPEQCPQFGANRTSGAGRLWAGFDLTLPRPSAFAPVGAAVLTPLTACCHGLCQTAGAREGRPRRREEAGRAAGALTEGRASVCERASRGVFPVQRLNACVSALTS
jgi:hypothetical protein